MSIKLLEVNKYFFAPTENIVMERGEGIYLWDSTGKRYIDCAAATFNLSLGYSNQEVLEAVAEQADKLVHITSSYMSEPVAKLVEKLVEVTPKSLTKIHLKVSGGSTANEGAIKMAQFYNKKSGVISLFRSHVGQTIYTMNASGLGFRRQPFASLGNSGIVHVPPAYCYRCFYNQKPCSCGMLCAERIEEFIKYAGNDSISSMIVEPILGNGDNIVPPKEYFVKLRELADKHHFTLIFDEIQTGIGRTGKMFAADYFGVEPDIMTIAKGLGGTGFQIAAIATKEEYADMDSHYHSFTYGSNSLASAAGVKTLEIITRPGFLDNVTLVGNYIIRRLNEMKEKYSFIGDVRGVGLMIGFEIVDEKGEESLELTTQIKNIAFENGLIMRTSRYGIGNVLKIRPALILTLEQAKEICEILEYTFDQIEVH
ncbi:aspartate aminotransferase family protein [Anaeromicropila populeti]|uniref:4-aminobutyrate aminotransferase n=1 Tax=Anaeromicropila populeti TaxID=37658 RepID=A0A1I6L665_9FIRM|nr:aspartate aminotransferase family protein [Anaeromicropila populeti]SFR98973.1 4-aminobutyrate aminotransferase [Anaeromicropila populeti]